MDNGGFVAAAYVVTGVLVSLYTWRLAGRLRQARDVASGKQRGA
ncbi:MAG TPA: hypothetical protein VLV16_13800 [Gemmatimonadales bacterium]|nr:hypothetical protein [Gemmatimonadales bacterium]